MDIPDEFLMCRDYQHSWDPYDFRVSRSAVTRRNEMLEVVRCTRCGTLKTRVMTTAGEILRNSYTYPAGYLLTEQGRMSPADRGKIRTRNRELAFAHFPEEET